MILESLIEQEQKWWGCKILNDATEKLYCAAVIPIVLIVAITTYVIGEVKKILNIFNMASRVNCFSNYQVCNCSLLSLG